MRYSRVAKNIGVEDMSHTPGPLFVHDFRGASPEPCVSDICVSCDHPAHIAVCTMGPAFTNTTDEALANAHLFSSAPDLLEALEECSDTLKHFMSTLATNAYHETYYKARAAIKKARGIE